MKRARLSALLIFICGIFSAATVSAEELVPPVFIDYNTYIGRQNILELISVGEDPLEVELTIFRSSGGVKTKQNLTINPLNQFDVLINDLVDEDDTYGLIQIDFNEDNAKLVGRMSVYRANQSTRGSGDFSFAFAKELQSALTGTSYVTGNSYDPQGRGFLVANWLEISNIEFAEKTFTHNLYDAGGTLLSTQMVTVPPRGKFDVSSGHERGQGVYLNEIIPTDATGRYLASVTRYASNARNASTRNDYSYAFSAYAKPGEGDDQYAFIENREGDCYEQTSWVEVTNVAAVTANATLTFYNSDGELKGTTGASFAPRTQLHFNGTLMLDDGETGFVKVTSDTADAFLVQSAVYFHSCNSNDLQTAYFLPAQIVQTPALVGSYNLYLGMENELNVISASSVNRNVAMTLSSNGSPIFNNTRLLKPNEINPYQLNDVSSFNTATDTYGTILLDANEAPSFVPFVLRTRRAGTTSEIVDFVMPTLFGEQPDS